jgi:hypothetical protein
MSIKPIETSEYFGTYYVEEKTPNGVVTHERVYGTGPLPVAKKFLSNPIKCKKDESTLFVISNSWRFGKNPPKNYYK